MNNFTIALAGNPNVGKSTIFNCLTGMHQHTGNWPGKTVENATGNVLIYDKNFTFVDIPGTYSIMSNSEEEEIARDYICFEKPNVTVIVADATCLERNMNLLFQIMEITPDVILCVNLLDEAKNKKIKINLDKLETLLGIPVVGTTAKKKKTLEKLKDVIYKVAVRDIVPKPKKIIYDEIIESCILDIKNKLDNSNYNEDFLRWVSIKIIDGEKGILNSIKKHTDLDIENKEIEQETEKVYAKLEKYNINKENFKDKIVSNILEMAEGICKEVCTFENENYSLRDRKIDKVLTSKRWGIPIMIIFLGVIFWITIVGANYPSQILFSFFNFIQQGLIYITEFLNFPSWLSNMLIYGMYQTLTWVISVMLPPMAIFFPLFTFLEDLGYLPRIAFNMDKFFKKACCSGKQIITMCMGVTKWEIFKISHFVFLYLTDLPEFYRNTIFYYIVTCKDNF